MKKAAKSHASPEAVARAVADCYAAAVEFPNTLIPQDAPVGIIAQHMVEGRCPGAGEPFEEGDLGSVRRYVRESVPDCDDQTATGSQYPEHLAERLLAIREEHETKLTQNRVERSVREWYRLGRALAPVDGGCTRSPRPTCRG